VPTVKLSFGEVLSEAFAFFFANIRLFFYLVTIPWILSVAIRAIGAIVDFDSPVAVLLEKAIDVVPTTMFMVAWQRVVLLGPHRLDHLPGTAWTPRETAYLAHLIKVAGMTFLLAGAFIFAGWPLDSSSFGAGRAVDPEVVRRQALAAPLAIGFLVSIVLALRVSFGLAASAVDVPFSPRLSWAFSRGNGWTIIATLFLAYFAGAITTGLTAIVVAALMRGILGAREAAAVVSWTVAILVSYGGVALTATVQAVIFRRLLNWREGAGLPVLTQSQ
jgi:hypothetical protein